MLVNWQTTFSGRKRCFLLYSEDQPLCGIINTNATTWEHVRKNFITRFSDGRNKFRYRMEAEHCIRGDGEEIRNFLHGIKRRVDKGWPDDLNGIEAAHHAAEREAQGRQRKQRYIDCSRKGLRPRYLQRKAQE